MLSPEHATIEAEKFLQEQNIMALPIDPIAIAGKLGILVQAKPASTKGVSGMLIRNSTNDQFAIAYATHIKSMGFQRFSVSHELGHYQLPGHVEAVLGSQNIHESRAGFVSDNTYEREADHFAAGLLMPSDLFRKELKAAGEGMDAIETLAAKCITSLPATAIRYMQHTEIPATVILSVGDHIEWCFMSNELKEIPGLDWIKKHEPLPKSTTTYTFNKDNSNIASAKRKDTTGNLQDWFNGRYNIEVVEEVKGLGQYGRTLTVLTVENLDIEELQENENLEESWIPHFRR